MKKALIILLPLILIVAFLNKLPITLSKKNDLN